MHTYILLLLYVFYTCWQDVDVANEREKINSKNTNGDVVVIQNLAKVREIPHGVELVLLSKVQ